MFVGELFETCINCCVYSEMSEIVIHNRIVGLTNVSLILVCV